jgi:hypothetical protein
MDLSAYLNDTNAITAAYRAAAAWTRINDKPSSVAFKKPDGTVLTAQTVRLEYDNRATEAQGSAGKAPVRKLTIFGVRNHATVTNTIVDTGYRFVLDGREYRVVDTIVTIGEIQATAEVV